MDGSVRRTSLRAGRVMLEALHPLPLGFDIAQGVALFVGSLGAGGWLARQAGLIPGVLLVVAVLAVLLFVAAFRMQATLDASSEKKPLIAVRPDPDRGFVRMVVKNPNPFMVHGVFVQLEAMVACDTTHPDLPRPAMGYRFPWPSWATGTGSLVMDFPAGHKLPVDIAARPIGNEPPNLDDGSPTFFFVHMVPGQDGLTVRPTYLQARGTYRLTLTIESPDLPSKGKVIAEVRFDERAQLDLVLMEPSNVRT